MDLTKLFALRRPCANCPFLKVGAIPLRPGRVEGIIKQLTTDDQSTFPCHKTTHKPGKTPSYCVGALVYLDKAKSPNVAMRLGVALGMYDPDALTPCYDDVIEPPLCD